MRLHRSSRTLSSNAVPPIRTSPCAAAFSRLFHATHVEKKLLGESRRVVLGIQQLLLDMRRMNSRENAAAQGEVRYRRYGVDDKVLDER